MIEKSIIEGQQPMGNSQAVAAGFPLGPYGSLRRTEDPYRTITIFFVNAEPEVPESVSTDSWQK